MRLDSSFESLVGLASGRSGSVADLADETPRRNVHRHSYAAPAHNDPDMPTPTKPFGLGKNTYIIISLYQTHTSFPNNIQLYIVTSSHFILNSNTSRRIAHLHTKY